jgi:hypothetical protein
MAGKGRLEPFNRGRRVVANGWIADLRKPRGERLGHGASRPSDLASHRGLATLSGYSARRGNSFRIRTFQLSRGFLPQCCARTLGCCRPPQPGPSAAYRMVKVRQGSGKAQGIIMPLITSAFSTRKLSCRALSQPASADGQSSRRETEETCPAPARLTILQ